MNKKDYEFKIARLEEKIEILADCIITMGQHFDTSPMTTNEWRNLFLELQAMIFRGGELPGGKKIAHYECKYK